MNTTNLLALPSTLDPKARDDFRRTQPPEIRFHDAEPPRCGILPTPMLGRNGGKAEQWASREESG